MHRLAIIGDTDSVLAFRAVGFDTFLTEARNAPDLLKEKYNSGTYAAIFLSETLAGKMEEQLAEYDKKPFPAVGILPLGRIREMVGTHRMKKISIRATGTDILSKL